MVTTEQRSPVLVLKFHIIEHENINAVSVSAISMRAWGGQQWISKTRFFDKFLEARTMQTVLIGCMTEMHNEYIRAMRSLQGTRWGRHL